MKVLLVENEDEMRGTVTDFLERFGYKVVAATVPREAEAHLKRERVDAAVIDVRLKDEGDNEDWSGLVLARQVAEREIPVIILSAYDSAEDIERAFDVAPGVKPPYAFVSKNRQNWEKELEAALEDALREKRQSRWRRVVVWLKVVWAFIKKARIGGGGG